MHILSPLKWTIFMYHPWNEQYLSCKNHITVNCENLNCYASSLQHMIVLLHEFTVILLQFTFKGLKFESFYFPTQFTLILSSVYFTSKVLWMYTALHE
jgi:hypothetical protein